MSEQGGGETRCGIGARLRAGREHKGLTVLQAAEKMHVDARILESLEAENFEALGAPVFVRGHLRHFADLVGEQPAELLSLYANSARVAQPDLTRIPKIEAPVDSRRFAVPAAVVLVGFAVAGGLWWVLSLPKLHSRAAQAQSLAAPAPDLAQAPGSAALVQTTPAQQPTPLTSAPAGTPAAPLSPAAARTPRQAELTLRFTAESWAEVYDSAGARLFYDIGPAASTRTFKGTPPLRVVLGNAPGVAVEVNGHAANLASLTRADGSAQFTVNRSGRATGAPP